MTKKCVAHDTEWMNIWKMFSKEEVAWFKKEYPAEPTEGDVRTVSMGQMDYSKEGRDATVNYKEAMATAKVRTKEAGCFKTCSSSLSTRPTPIKIQKDVRCGLLRETIPRNFRA